MPTRKTTKYIGMKPGYYKFNQILYTGNTRKQPTSLLANPISQPSLDPGYQRGSRKVTTQLMLMCHEIVFTLHFTWLMSRLHLHTMSFTAFSCTAFFLLCCHLPSWSILTFIYFSILFIACGFISLFLVSISWNLIWMQGQSKLLALTYFVEFCNWIHHLISHTDILSSLL
jgi:hypothetical protein